MVNKMLINEIKLLLNDSYIRPDFIKLLNESLPTINSKTEFTDFTPYEVLFGFVVYLTTREESITVGAHYEVDPILDLLLAFVKENNVSDLMDDNWTDKLKFPKE